MKRLPLFLGIIGLLLFQSVSCVPITDFYPFGINHGDDQFPKNDDGSSPRVPISSLFPFFNNQHNSLYVNTNGAISFQQVISQYTPQPFPLSDGRRVIAPFWADVDIRNGGTVWYRESTDSDLLRRATQEVRLYYPSQINFRATWIFIATWDNVAFYGASDIGKQKRNSFQAVLITNGRHSFTVFNYYRVTWTTGTASQGNSNTGLGGTPAQVGFNGGDGINFFVVNQSRTAEIINLPQLSNVKVPGKFVFRIDTASIEKGGCNTKGTVTVTPRYIPMFGGKLITVAGPCIDSNDTAEIIFDSHTTTLCVRRSPFSVQCSTPIFYKTGDVTVSFKVTHADQRTTFYTGVVTLLNPIRTTPTLIRENPQDWKRNNHVQLFWDSQRIPFDVNSASLEVWTLSPTLDSGPPVLEHYRTIKSTQDQPVQSFLIDFEITLAVLKMSASQEGLTQTVWSDVFYIPPLTDFMGSEFCKLWQQFDDTLPDISQQNVQECPCTIHQATIDHVRFQDDPNCNLSVDDDRQYINCAFNPEARHCFRLNVPGPQNTGRLCCYDSNGSLMDVRTRNGGGSIHRRHYLGGPGNVPYLSHFVSDIAPYLECCIHGASASCKQYLKRRPQGNCENYTPVSFGFPNVLCCVDGTLIKIKGPSENEQDFVCRKGFYAINAQMACDANFRFVNCVAKWPGSVHDSRVFRESSLCRTFESGRIGGDPHFTTLDGLAYTFNGVGEFVLLTTNDNLFVAQVRMERVKDEHGNPKQASVITSFVAKSYNVSDNVEIRLNTIRVADVLVNGLQIDFTETNFLEFTEVSVSTTSNNVSDGSMRQFSVVFKQPPIAFRVLAYTSLLNTFVTSGADDLKGNISGLLGNYNGHPKDDLRASDGACIPANSSTEVIHREFGLKYENLVSLYRESECLFTYPRGKTFHSYQDVSFTPVFTLPPVSSEAREICGDDEFCLYDFHTTGDQNIAASTKAATQTLKVFKEKAKKVKSCGFPPNIVNGSWNSTGVTINSTAVLACDEGFAPFAEHQISCTSDDYWTQSNDTCEVVECGPPYTIRHGQWAYTETTYNSNATLLCEEGYFCNESISISCKSDGLWDSIKLSCEAVSCDALGSPDNGTWDVSDVIYNSTAELVCDVGFSVQTPVKIICQSNGQWTNQTDNCTLVDCGVPDKLGHSSWYYTDTTYNSTANLSCDDGFNNGQSTTIVCRSSGLWDSTHKSCEAVSCGEPTAPTHGEWITTGLQYTFTGSLTCDKGYTTNISRTIHCLSNGSWTSTDAVCSLVDCGKPANVEHGSVNFTTTTFDSVVTLKCHDGLENSGSLSFTCLDSGRWNVTYAQCIDKSTLSQAVKQTWSTPLIAGVVVACVVVLVVVSGLVYLVTSKRRSATRDITPVND